jgi:hypothetical protein
VGTVALLHSLSLKWLSAAWKLSLAMLLELDFFSHSDALAIPRRSAPHLGEVRPQA